MAKRGSQVGALFETVSSASTRCGSVNGSPPPPPSSGPEPVPPSGGDSAPNAVFDGLYGDRRASQRVASRTLSAADHVLIRKTSVMLSNPATAAETVFTHAEMKRLELFNAKFLEKPLVGSTRTLRPHTTRSSADVSYSELQPTLGLSDLVGEGQESPTSKHVPPPLWLTALRRRLQILVKTSTFRAAVHFVVFADMVVLALDDEYSNARAAYAKIDIAFTVLMGIEIAIKSVAFGLYAGPESYLRRSRYRVLNIVVLAASLLSHLGGAKLVVLRGLKAFRSLTMFAGLRRILRSLIRAVPFLANVGTLALFFLLAFSIFGLEAFSGAYDGQCAITVPSTIQHASSDNNSSSSSSSDSLAQVVFYALPRVFCSEDASCAASNQTCFVSAPPSKHVHFDSGISSIFLVFLVVAQDGWVTDIMEPVLEGRSYWAVAFFVAIIVTLVFLVVNLFVAVITTAFMNFTIDDESDEHRPRFMGKQNAEDEDTHVSMIMGATLAIEESMHAEGGGEEELGGADDGSEEPKRSSRGSGMLGSSSPAAELILNGKAKEAMELLAQTQPLRAFRDLTAEATKELIQAASSLEEFMIPFAKAYQRHTSASKATQRGSVGENSSSELPLETRRSPATSRKPTLLVDIQEHATFEAHHPLPDTMTERSDEGLSSSRFARFQRVVFSKKFDDAITGCIILNTFLLLLEYPNMPVFLQQTLSVFEYLFGTIFFTEMAVRVVAMNGLRAYLQSTEHVFDLIVVVCTTANMILNNVDISYSGLNSVSSLRTLRVSRLMLKWEGTRKLIMSVLKSSRAIMDVVVFLVLFQVVNSILAMQFFGGAHMDSADNTPRWNFDTFGRSFLTLLQVITGDQWSSVAYDAVDAENPHWFLVPFLVVIFIFGQYVLLNLFIAVILDNFSISEEEAYQLQLAQIIAIPKELDILEKIEERGVCVFREVAELEDVSNVKLRMFLGLDDQQGHSHLSTMTSGLSNGRFLHANNPRGRPRTGDPSSGLWDMFASARRRYRFACLTLATSAWFSRFVQLVVVVSCVNLIIDDPHPEMSLTPPTDGFTRALTIANQVSLGVFFVEFAVKVSAFGFGFDYLRVSLFFKDEQLGYVTKHAYMEDKWNQLDFVLLVVAVVDEVVTRLYPALSAGGVFRAGRVLRPLRILNHNRDMKTILGAVAQSVPQVGNVFALCMIVYIIFGVVGRSLFAGKFYSCNDAGVKTATECIGFFLAYPDGALSLQEATARGVPSGAILVPRVWASARFSFDHIGVGFLTLLEMTSLKWIDKAFAAMDVAGQHRQPIQDNSPEAAIFFVLYVYVGSLFVIRLFVGVLVEQFQRNDGTQILTESQKSWVDLEKFVLLLKPLRLVPRPTSRVMSQLYDLCQHPRFAYGVSVAILLNILLLLANPSSATTTSTSYAVIEIIFLTIFTLEATIKCLALRHYYFLSPVGAFELGILIASLVAYFSASGYHSLIQAGRISRVMRVLRFVKLNRGVYTIFQTFRASLRPIGHIFFLLFLIIFIFAVIARQLFGGVKFGPSMNRFSNFRTFGSTVLLLFQIMSGDDWHLTMTDCMTAKPFCSERVYRKTGTVVTDCGSVPAASLFFVTYVTLVVFIFLNLFVTVILENFRSCYLKSDVCAISLLDFEKYREVFQRFDKRGHGTFPLWQLASFLAELPPSLRIERNRHRRVFLQIRDQAHALLVAAEEHHTSTSALRTRRPFFNELLRILCIHQMGIRSLPYEQQRDRVKQIFIYRGKVAQMLVESVVKGYVYRWRQRQLRQRALTMGLTGELQPGCDVEDRGASSVSSHRDDSAGISDSTEQVLSSGERNGDALDPRTLDAIDQHTSAGSSRSETKDDAEPVETRIEPPLQMDRPLSQVVCDDASPVASPLELAHAQAGGLRPSHRSVQPSRRHRRRRHKKKPHERHHRPASSSESDQSSGPEYYEDASGTGSAEPTATRVDIPSDSGDESQSPAEEELVLKTATEPRRESTSSPGLAGRRLVRVQTGRYKNKVVPT